MCSSVLICGKSSSGLRGAVMGREQDRRPLLDETRRHFFGRCGVGLGAMALADMIGRGEASAAAAPAPNPFAPKPGHFDGRARSVIYLFMAGGPSQLEM